MTCTCSLQQNVIEGRGIIGSRYCSVKLAALAKNGVPAKVRKGQVLESRQSRMSCHDDFNTNFPLFEAFLLKIG